MNFEDAIKEIDGEYDEQNGWSKKMMTRRGLHILKTKIGSLMQCTCDWPDIFYPTEEDKVATDWRIVTSTKE